MGADELIDAYLYELRSALQADGRERDRIVAEIEDHLWESWERYVDEGVAPDDAARLAIARFGGAQEIAAAFPPETAGRRFARLYFTAATLFATLLITIGLAAMITLPVHSVLGADFLYGPEGQWKAPARFCSNRDFALSECQQAWDDFFVVRAFGFGAAATLLGAMIASAHVLGARYAFGGPSRRTLVTGAYLFGIAAVLFLAGGTLKYAFGPESGWNTWLPAGLASMLTSSAFVALLRRSDDRAATAA
ncbi:MAG: permease prefix domain 1-containing protein [Dehalococcoidia bacterium]